MNGRLQLNRVGHLGLLLVTQLVLAVVVAEETVREDPCQHAPRLGFEPAIAWPSTYVPPTNLSTTSFVVLSMPRSATNTFVWTLDGNENIQAEGEVFALSQVVGRLGPGHNGPWTLETREANRTAFMRDLFEYDERPAKEGVMARGFKVFADHLARSEVELLARAKHVLKIVLRRQDTLSQYVSILRATKTDEWHRPKPGSKTTTSQDEATAATESAAQDDDVRVEVCVKAYQQWVNGCEGWFDWLAEESRYHPESWLFISTEQLLAGPLTMSTVYNYLRVPQGRQIDGYSPYTTDVLADKVTNYDEIAHLQPDVGNLW